MSHSSFEKIKISKEARLNQIFNEIKNIAKSIDEMSLITGNRNKWSIKKLEMIKHNLEVKYTKLYNEKEKDGHINFEELGVDSLVIDESHRYKNNLIYTKMQRVAGINTTSSNRAMDVHLKAQYISRLNNGKGVIYLTGTPITNSMSELYVLQNTLQPKDLEKKNINTFDKWVSTFGIVEESDEIKPEGTGYQKKMRLSKFHNLPELMKMFHNIADIKTAETLNLPRPTLKTGKEQIIKAELTKEQKAYVDLLVDRAEDIRRGDIDPEIDNFLKITLEAKLISVDPRILDNEIPYNANTKLNLCARKVAEIYHQTKDNKSTQIIFCDSGISKENKFNFYDALKLELLENGVLKQEIAYIHSAKTDEQKEKLFEKVRNGEIRVLIGSTEKMGVGTNVQDKLYALHNLDIPWRPDQLIQRNGRILRQGNENKEVEIFNYITEGSFDSYLYQILENKQKFISQVMTEKSPLRTCDDIDEVVLNYAEIKGLAMKNPYMKEKMQVETEINKINLLKGNWLDNKESYKNKIESLPIRIKNLEKYINNINLDIKTYKNNKPIDFEITLNNIKFNDKTKAGEYFMGLKRKIEREKNANYMQELGTYAGLKVCFTTTMGMSKVYLVGNKTYEKDLGISEIGNMTRLENLASDIEKELEIYENRLNQAKQDLKQAKEQMDKPFEYDERLNYLLKRKIEIDYNIQMGATKEENKSTIAKEIHKRIYEWGYKVLDGKTRYIKMEQEGFDDLVLENIGNKEYSIAHYSELNGDMMRSPEITFKIKKNEIVLTSYLDDYVGKYIEFKDKSDKEYKSVIEFFKTWVINIPNQFYNDIERLKKQNVKINKEIVETNHYEIDYSVMTVNEIKETFKIGTLIKLENMQGENLPTGITGAVTGVDDMGQVRVVWENGSSLALNVKVDKFEIINTEYSKDIEEEYTEENMWEEVR